MCIGESSSRANLGDMGNIRPNGYLKKITEFQVIELVECFPVRHAHHTPEFPRFSKATGLSWNTDIRDG